MSSIPVPNPDSAIAMSDDGAWRRSLRDIVALTSLAAVWSGREPDAIAGSLVKILRANLDIEVAAVKVSCLGRTFVATAGTGAVTPEPHAISEILDGGDFGVDGGGLRVAAAPLGYNGEYGRVVLWSRDTSFPREVQRFFLNVAVNQAAMAVQAYSLLRREQTARRRIERLFELGKLISGEMDRGKLVQAITDAATELSGAQFGSFFYNLVDERGESYMLYSLSGVPREHFARFPMPRNTALFGPTFRGEGVLRIADVRTDRRYGKNSPYYGMPPGHLPVVSYLAVPVVSRSGEVLGGLFFGHPEADVFTEEHERVVSSLAAQAAIALDNQRLFESAELHRRELQANNEQISNILDSIKDGFFAVDRFWRYTFVNERGAQICQTRCAQLMGRSFWELFRPTGKMADALRRAMEERTPAHVEEYDETRGAWLEADAYPTRDGLAILLTDVTERKHFDEQLRQTQKLESLGLLAGGIAHDFNNLLTGILGNASLLRDELPPTLSLHEFAGNIVEASERAAHLTAQLLAYAGKGRFVIEAVNVSHTVESITKLLSSSVPKHVRVDLDLDPDLPKVMADTAQVQQLIMNLVMNAAEAIPTNRPGTVAVNTRRHTSGASLSHPQLAHGELGPGEYVCLAVRDDGCGMDEETLRRIFDPFFTTKFTGRGLGLSAVLGIVLGHQGALQVFTEPGRGTTFEVLLPTAAASERSGGDAAATQPSGERLSGTVLVIDDEEVVRSVAKATLSRCGCQVLSAANGSEGVELFRVHRRDISAVLLDLTMPDMNGETALRNLQAIDPDVKVVLSSGYSESEILRRFGGQRFAGFIHKPYTSRALIERVAPLLKD